jgi:hypothetical protein
MLHFHSQILPRFKSVIYKDVISVPQIFFASAFDAFAGAQPFCKKPLHQSPEDATERDITHLVLLLLYL